MKSTLVLCSLVALSTALNTDAMFPHTDVPVTCAVLLCGKEEPFCRDILNTTTDVVGAECLGTAMTSLQDNQCENGFPLLVATGGDITQANCGSERDAIKCPSGFHCILGSGGAFSVCCRDDVLPLFPKPGQCPAVQSGQVGICASNCKTDGDCKGQDKCCKNPCGSLTCQAPDLKTNPCDEVKCRPGDRCVVQQVQCVRYPCFPVAACVPDCTSGNCSTPGPVLLPTDLPSTCASTLCEVGTICREVLNPANDVVQGQCLAPPLEPLNESVCRDGQPLWVRSQQGPVEATCGRHPDRIDCPGGYTCNIAPNDAYAVCCPVSPPPLFPKPGQCPAVQPGQVGICASNCKTDGDCKGQDKCCKNPCGSLTCQAPDLKTNPCDEMKCRPGDRCVLQQVQCVRFPCFPVAACVPDCKSGNCPPVRPFLPPTNLPGTCASTLCEVGTICREVLNPANDVVQGQCLAPTPEPLNENVCRNGQPLWVTSETGTVQATCGRHPDRINCPSGYTCNIAPNDAYAVCCPVRLATFGGAGDSDQKSGQCPEIQLGDFAICTSLCHSDSQCQGNQKCCKNSCGATVCKNPVAERPSCKTVKCSAGFTCEMQKPAFCFRFPCYPRPACVPIKKPGVCPRPRFSFSAGCVTRCQNDQNCPGSRKCCKGYFCGTTCENPQRPVLTCATVDCRPGYVCKDKPVYCFVPPCPTRPVCERVPDRGSCPIFPAFVDPNCSSRDVCRYNDSSSCPRGTLCCSTPCGRQCVKPLE